MRDCRAFAAWGLLLAACAEGGGRTSTPGEPDRPVALVYEREREGNADIYWTDPTHGWERRLTRHPARDVLPRWTPDGRAVIFSSERDGHWQLYRVASEPDGSPPVRLRANEHLEWQADPTPDGTGLVFLSNLAGAQGLFVVPWQAGEPRLLVQHGRRIQLGNPHCSRDGGRVVYSSNRGVGGHRIYLTRLSDGEETRLSPLTSGGCEPRFRPDGRAVAYVRRRHATRHRSWIVEHDLESGGERELVSWPALNYDPVYSPDGAELAFASTIADGQYAVFRIRLGDARSWRVTVGPGGARHPDYRPAP
jgi:TolB protein